MGREEGLLLRILAVNPLGQKGLLILGIYSAIFFEMPARAARHLARVKARILSILWRSILCWRPSEA